MPSLDTSSVSFYEDKVEEVDLGFDDSTFIYFKRIPQNEYIDLMYKTAVVGSVAEFTKSSNDLHAMLIAKSVVDEDGKPVWTYEQVQRIQDESLLYALIRIIQQKYFKVESYKKKELKNVMNSDSSCDSVKIENGLSANTSTK